MEGIIKGIVCPNITPFTKERELDKKSLQSVCRYLIDKRINGLFSLGTNGESLLLNIKERKEAAEIVVSEVSKQIPVVIQCGASSTENTIELAKHAALIGADGVGILAPNFFAQDTEAIFNYYIEVANSIPNLPAYIYNIPTNTNNDIMPELADRIRKATSNIVGIKYSFTDLFRLVEYIKLDKSFDALIGCDKLVLPALTLGAVGTVSGPSAVFPELFSGLWEAYRRRNFDTAKEYQLKIYDIDKALSVLPQIPLLKTYLKEIGVIVSDTCRTPFRSLTLKEKEYLMAIVDKYRQ
jgi:dihydrodipicolinate synthase/N-acetylneuraminate lyase